MTQIIDLLLTAPDESQALALLDQIGWMGLDVDDKPQIQPPFKCEVMAITLWRSLPSDSDAGEQAPGYWMGLCIPDDSLLDELWQLPGVVAALDRASGKILRLKGFTLDDVNALEAIQPQWAGPPYDWRNLKMM